MNWFTKAMLVLLAALWPLVTSHCSIEVVSNFNFLACGEANETDSHENDGCETDPCTVVESGFYKIEEKQISVIPPLLAALFELDLQIQTADSVQSAVLIFPPPELPKQWQFSQRAVAPPRAPSFVS